MLLSLIHVQNQGEKYLKNLNSENFTWKLINIHFISFCLEMLPLVCIKNLFHICALFLDNELSNKKIC